MNERIKELAEQAGLSKNFNPLVYEQWYLNAVEKFAELIVKECAAIDFYKLAGIGTEGDYNVTQVIKQHFGVEE